VKTTIVVTNITITDQQYTIEYVASDIGVVGRVRVPFDILTDEESIKKCIIDDLEKIKDKIEKIQELKKAYAGQGFVLELK
jgi:hypothetical protein